MAQDSSRVLAFVGSYTEPVSHAPTAHGAGVTILDIDLVTGTIEQRFCYPEIPNPGYLCVDALTHTVYVVSEVYGGRPGTVSALHFDFDYRALLDRTDLPTGGTVPSYVSLAGTDRLLVSNYGDGSLAVFSRRPNGLLDARVALVPIEGSGPDPDRQLGAHAHCVLPHPSNGLIYAVDLGADAVLVASLHETGPALTVNHEVKTAPGSGPRHLRFADAGDAACVVYELTSRLGVFDLDAEGVPHERQVLSMLPDGYAGESFGADAVVTADGRHVYASNRGHDSVVRFDRTGRDLRAAAWYHTAQIPRSLALSPLDRYLLVANQESDAVQVFERADDGELTATFAVPIDTPVCVVCIAVDGAAAT